MHIPSSFFLFLAVVVAGLASAWFAILREKKLRREMRRRLYELSVLKELDERIGYSLNTQKIVDVISRSLGTFISYSAVSYIFIEPEKLLFNCNLRESVSRFFIDDVRNRMLASLGALLDRDLRAVPIDESLSGEILDETKREPVRSFFNIPLVIAGEPVGVLMVASMKSGLYREEEMTILYKIVNQASTAVSKLQAVLALEQRKLQEMVASMADGVLMVDSEWRTIVLNATLCDMLQLTIPKPVFVDVLRALQDRIDLRQKITESMESEKTVVIPALEYTNHFFQIIVSPVHTQQLGKPVLFATVVLFHDVTKEKEIERIRDNFTSMMVHDLKAPLDGIRKITELLERPAIADKPDQQKPFLDLIQKNASNMLLLVSDLLDVARMEEGKFPIEKVVGQIDDVMREEHQNFSSLYAQKHLHLSLKAPSAVPSAAFDRRRIRQVFNNFLSNALKFTPPGGTITMGLFVHEAKGDVRSEAAHCAIPWSSFPLHTKLASLPKSIVVTVADTGAGISEEKVGRLFTKWQRLDMPNEKSEGGTGLGLVIVKGIVEAHGGTVGVLSEEGVGTLFYCTLPLA